MRLIDCLASALLLVAPMMVHGQESRSYEWSVGYTADLVRNLHGGVEQGSRYLDNLDVGLSIPLGGVPERPGTFLISAVYNNGTRFSDLVGDLQGTSNIDAPGAVRLYEMWYELEPIESVSIKAGRLDLNGEFDVLEAAQLFLHSSHGIGGEFGQSGQNGPSIFPVTTLGARVSLSAESWGIQAAIFDAVAGDPNNPKSNRLELGDGTLAVVEFQQQWRDAKILAGYWQYSDEFSRIADPTGLQTEDGNDGWYLGIEREAGLWSGFVRYGRADSTFNPIASYLGVGVVRSGLFSDHSLGIAVATAFTGSDYRLASAVKVKQERTIELTYQIPVNSEFSVQFDLQDVRRPAGLPDLDTALVVNVRLTYAPRWGQSKGSE